MANRTDIIKAFQYGAEKGKASSLSIKKTGKGTSLYSYATPIAYRDDRGNIYMTDKKFSQTTTVQQNSLKRSANVNVEPNEEFKGRYAYSSTGRL